MGRWCGPFWSPFWSPCLGLHAGHQPDSTIRIMAFGEIPMGWGRRARPQACEVPVAASLYLPHIPVGLVRAVPGVQLPAAFNARRAATVGGEYEAEGQSFALFPTCFCGQVQAADRSEAGQGRKRADNQHDSAGAQSFLYAPQQVFCPIWLAQDQPARIDMLAHACAVQPVRLPAGGNPDHRSLCAGGHLCRQGLAGGAAQFMHAATGQCHLACKHFELRPCGALMAGQKGMLHVDILYCS